MKEPIDCVQGLDSLVLATHLAQTLAIGLSCDCIQGTLSVLEWSSEN